MRAVLNDWHRYRRGRARARGAAERRQRTPEAQRLRRRHELATLGFARGRRAARGGRHKSSPPLTHTKCETCTSPPSTPAAMCANPSHPPEFRAKFGGASEASRRKSRGGGHARRLETVWRFWDRRQPSCESGSICEHLLRWPEFEFTRVFTCAALGGVLRSTLYESP